MVDVDDFGFGGPADQQRPRTYSFPTCNVPNAYGPGTVPEYMGTSPGWGDVYTWDLPQQYIDISKGVPDGEYMVVSKSNFDNGMLTSDRSAETGITCIQITGNTVKTVAELPSQADDAPLPSCSGAAGAKRATARHHVARRAHHHRRR